MNTVLDDNMTLCLANSERIKLRPELRMLFEVQDLAVASPATVSRCGMVYMTPEDLGWLPFVQSWIPRFYPDESVLTEDLKQLLLDLFVQAANMGLDKIRHPQIKEPIPTVDIQQVVSVCNFLEAFMNPQNGMKEKLKLDEKKRMLQGIFSFSFAWGMGGSLDEFGKE